MEMKKAIIQSRSSHKPRCDARPWLGDAQSAPITMLA